MGRGRAAPGAAGSLRLRLGGRGAPRRVGREHGSGGRLDRGLDALDRRAVGTGQGGVGLEGRRGGVGEAGRAVLGRAAAGVPCVVEGRREEDDERVGEGDTQRPRARPVRVDRDMSLLFQESLPF